MTTDKYCNIFRHFRMSRDEILNKMNNLYDQSRSPERQMKLQALESLLRETP